MCLYVYMLLFHGSHIYILFSGNSGGNYLLLFAEWNFYSDNSLVVQSHSLSIAQ